MYLLVNWSPLIVIPVDRVIHINHKPKFLKINLNATNKSSYMCTSLLKVLDKFGNSKRQPIPEIYLVFENLKRVSLASTCSSQAQHVFLARALHYFCFSLATNFLSFNG